MGSAEPADLLEPIRIVDASRILAGPFATQLLADLGATVIKVEPPAGDPTRSWGPPFATDDPGQPSGSDGSGNNGDSAYFRCANRGKQGIRLDLRSEADRDRLFDLIRDADVFVENFLPDAAARLGLTWTALHARFEQLIVASVRAFASDTEAANRPGYDFLLQAQSGWMSVTGEPDGRPMKVGMALVDVLAALYLANGIQAALLQRQRNGQAVHVEVPLMETAIAGLINVGAGELMTGKPACRFGNAHPNIVPYQTFSCADGDAAIAVGNDRQFRQLMSALDLLEQFDAHPDWKDNPGRVRDRDALVAVIEQRTRTLGRDDVIARCGAAGVAAGPVCSVTEVLGGRIGVLHRSVVELVDPDSGKTQTSITSPLLINGKRACHDRIPPA